MKLLLVDDDLLILKSLEITLSKEPDITIIGCATDGAKALAMCQKQPPDIILMDIRMPGVDGVSATGLIKNQFPDLKIMMLTTFDDRANIQQALDAGADGYLLKTDRIADIASKLRVMLSGAGIMSVDALKKLGTKENPTLQSLTKRERDIVRLVAQGYTNKEIAATLFLSVGTVRNNMMVIMEKLDLKNRTQVGMAYYNIK